MLKAPTYLTEGDKIQVLSPSGCINPQAIENARILTQRWNLEMFVSPSALVREGIFAGSDQERLRDLQTALDNPEIKAIFCSRGGYGCARIVDDLDFTGFKKHPKWIVGFSDITVLHSHINNLGFETIHGVMPNSYPLEENNPVALTSLHKALFGEDVSYTWEANILDRDGFVRAPVIGGNLSVLYSLRGTPTDVETDDKILFIEDLGEYYYHLDRMMSNLHRGGLLSNLAGLLIGSFSDMKDGAYSYGKSAEEIIREHVAQYEYPLAFGFSAGHIRTNQALYLGRDAILKIDKNTMLNSLFYDTIN